jgi:hypothetical protein
MHTTINILDQLMTLRFPDEVAMVLGISFNRKNLLALLRQNPRLIRPDGANASFTTMFFKITTIEGGHRNEISIIHKKTGFNLASESDISGFFRQRILRHFKARRYLLFTWDHGNGHEIFDTANQRPHGLESNKIVNSNPETPVLTMDELSRAIRWSLGPRKIHLLIMMNCNMQVFDTGYALRKNVKYLIAPQTTIGVLDYYYQHIFSHLAKKPHISPRALADYVIKSFRENVEDYGYAKNVVLSACRLKHVQEVARGMNKLATKYIAQLEVDRSGANRFRAAFQKTSDVDSGLNLKDLYSFLIALATDKKAADAEETRLLNELLNLERKIVFRKYTGPEVERSYHGLSIITPFEDKKIATAGIRRVASPEDPVQQFFKKSIFLRRSKWGEFMKMLKKIDLADARTAALATAGNGRSI